MDENVKQPDIALQEIFFQRINFSQIRGGQPGEVKLQIKNTFEFQKSNDNKNLKAIVYTTIGEPSGRISIDISSIGVFKVREDVSFDDPKYAQIMVNTIWPFVRSQVSLLTTQPGITPVLLPLLTPKVTFKEEQTIFA